MKTPSGYPAAFFAVAAGWLVFSWPWLSGSVTIPYDLKAHFQPQLQFLATALHSGQSPFWTPNVFGGSPQIADPQSLIFSPAFLIAYFNAKPSFFWLDAYCFGLLGLAAFSVLMIFKDRGWHPAGATVAALATAFGGSAIWRIQHLKQIESFAFFLLCFWLLARTLDRHSLGYGLLAGLAAGFMIVAPGQIGLLGGYLLAGYVLHHLLTSPHFGTELRKSFWPLGMAAGVGSALAIVPIVLTFLFVKASNRPAFDFPEAARGALHPASLLTAIVPDLYGVRPASAEYWGPGGPDWQATWLSMSENMGQIYLGAIPIIVLVTVGVMRGVLWTRGIRYFTIAGGLLLVYSLGWYTPFFKPIFDAVPGVDLFRRPSDATYQLCAMLAIVSGYLVHRLATRSLSVAGQRHRYVETGLVAALVFTAGCVALYRGHFQDAVIPLLAASVFLTVGGLLLRYLSNRPDQAPASSVLLLALFMIVDLCVNNGPNRSTAKPYTDYSVLNADTDDETIRALKHLIVQTTPGDRRDRVEMTGLGFEWPNASLVHGFDHVLGYNPVRLGEIIDATGADETVAETRQRRFTPLFPSYDSTMANLLGLRFIALPVPVAAVDKHSDTARLPLISRTKAAFIYENPNALPRVLFTQNWLPASLTLIVKTGEWPVFDPRTTVLLDEDTHTVPHRAFSTPFLNAGDENGRAGVVSIVSYKNTVIDIDADSVTPGFAVLNDVWHPWWYATVDGAEVPILRANVIFRAVEIPAGKHRVRFEFRPFRGALEEIGHVIAGKVKASSKERG